VKQGADAVELDAGSGVKPAEAADAMKAGGQDVLEEAADQLEGFQVQVLFTARGAVAVTPAHPATCLPKPRRRQVGEQREVAVAGSGLEDVAVQIGVA